MRVNVRHRWWCALCGVWVLVWLGAWCCAPAGAAEPAPSLRVLYTPPTLSVVAQGVSLSQIVRAIGERAGFVVIDLGTARSPLRPFTAEALLHDVLAQLLRGENYALIYRSHRAGPEAGDAGIAKIVLLGPVRFPAAAAPVYDREQGRAAAAEEGLRRLAKTSQALAAPPAGAVAVTAHGTPASAPPASGAQAAPQLEELLWRHAFTGALPAPDSAAETLPDSAPRSLNGPVLPSHEAAAHDLDATLALTTRMAQHNLQALLTGLTAATASLQDALTAQDQ